MPTSFFDLLPTFLMAVLASWLGLSLLVRAPRERAAQVFAWLCLNLTLYGLSTSLAQISNSASARETLLYIQVLTTLILPPVYLHFVMVIAGVQAWRVVQRSVLLLSYMVGLIMSGYALFADDMIVTANSVRFPSGPLTILWLTLRIVPLLLTLVLVSIAYRHAEDDELERRRRALFGVAAMIAVSGAILASIARDRFSQAPGQMLMDTGLAMMAYAVLAYRMLLPARVAQRAFYRSLLGGVFTALYAGLLIVFEPLVGRALGIQMPVLSIFALIVLMALFGPLRDAVGGWLDRRFFHREFDYGQLLKAVGDDLFERGNLDGQLEAALAAMCRTLGVRAGFVAVKEGAQLRLAAHVGQSGPESLATAPLAIPETVETHFGDWAPWPEARLLLPLRRNDETLGLLGLSERRSGTPYGEVERVLLGALSSYLALAIRHDRNQREEELAMAVLAEQSRQLRAEQEQLALQSIEAAKFAQQRETAPRAPEVSAEGLRVYALGPLRVERDQQPIERWGGDKAGTYQAEALFAFLFDRRGRGVTKDEVEELIWPDLLIDKADVAFHRTVSGLRRTLEPGLRRGNESRVITYHHERYWLDPAAIGWSDIDRYVTAVEQGHSLMRQNQIETARESFREALSLYRGDYMDDCPFFGDSSHVEERRTELRDLQIGALLALGTLYEQLGQTGEAVGCYRRALTTSQEDCPRAEDALARLQVGAV